MNQRRVLVTGASGFIGSHLVCRLLAEGAVVAVTVRYGNVMKNERLRDCWDRLYVIEADLRNRGALEAICQFAPEIVFHLAAYNHVGESFRQVEECFDVNAKGTANLLDMTSAARKFIYLSTSEVYGDQGQVPFRESMCPRPASPYAITKYAGELYCRMKQRTEAGRSIVLLRAFNTYGPYQSGKAVVGELIVNSLRGLPIRATKGEQTREFNFVGDIVEGLVKAANYDGAIDGPVNLGSGQEVAIRDLIAKVVALTGTCSSVQIGAIPYRPNEIWRMCADNTRAREILGWKPCVDLEEGLRRTIDWFRQYLAISGTVGES